MVDEMMGQQVGSMFPGNELDRHAKATPFALRLRDVPPNALAARHTCSVTGPNSPEGKSGWSFG